jgi:two-component system cell cycle response regulator DivK
MPRRALVNVGGAFVCGTVSARLGARKFVEQSRPDRTTFDKDAATGTRARPRILIVDDDPDARELYGWCMRAAGWSVAHAVDGVEALAMAETFHPNAIVMDLRMPILGGLEAIRRLKSDEQTEHIPIVACTGVRATSAGAEARAAGCDAFLAKPVAPEDLCDLLERLISGSA